MGDSILTHFLEGGWAMFVIVAFGLTGLGAAGRFALRGEHQLLGFVRWMAATTLGCGLFGFVAGMLKAIPYVVYRSAPAERWTDLLVGVKEALNNPAAALLFATLMGLCGAIGQRRFPLPNPSAVLR